MGLPRPIKGKMRSILTLWVQPSPKSYMYLNDFAPVSVIADRSETPRASSVSVVPAPPFGMGHER